MGSVKTHRTNWTAAEAVAFMRAQAAARSRDWERLCLGLCARAYGFAASGTSNLDGDPFVEACEYWESAKHRHPGDRRPPVGALACWTAPGRAGHIAVVVHSEGNDVRIASNDIGGVVAVVPLDYIEKNWGQKYEGWVEPDFPNGIGTNPAPRPRVRKRPPVVVWWQRLAFGVTDSDSVRALQQRLNTTVRARLEVTGNYDERTRAAVEKFQRKQGWTGSDADGLIFDPRARDGGKATTKLLFPEPRFAIRWDDPGTPAPVVPVQRTGRNKRKRPRTVSAAGVRMIAGFEGFRADLYDDPAGHCTIGYGHLVHHGRCNGSEPERFRAGLTEAEARKLLREDARPAAEAVNAQVKVPLSQPQFDALVSFVFNLGSGNLSRSQLLKRLNAGEYDAVPAELAKWVNAGGKRLPGLVSRRAAEGLLFATGKYPAAREPVSG